MARKRNAEVGWIERQMFKQKKKKIPGGISERDREVIRGYVSFTDSLERGHVPRVLRAPIQRRMTTRDRLLPAISKSNKREQALDRRERDFVWW